jgi:hypothetical protein
MELNKNYRIVYDSENTILQFFEQREKMVRDDENKRYVGTGTFREYCESYYYPSLKTALNGFLIKCTWGLETAKEVLNKLNDAELIINKINK